MTYFYTPKYEDMNIMNFLFLCGFVLLITVSCSSNVQKDDIYYNKDFDEITTVASATNHSFCIVLLDSLSITSDEYIEMIQKSPSIHKGTIYNFVNITADENKWYSKLLLPQIYPVTCVFNSVGQLIDLVSGNSRESVVYIAKAINTGQPCLEFHYNQKYDNDKIEMIHYIDNAIKLKSEIDKGKYIVDKIDSLLQISEHPYLLYWKLQNQLQLNKKTEAKETAKKLLSFDSAKDLLEYYNELLVANQLLDTTYNINTAPLISSPINKIELSDCDINHKYDLNIEIINKGEKPLKISDILTSCSCVEVKSTKKHIVNSNECLLLNVEFTPDVSGDLFREVYIISNSLNTPIYTISINATVK